MSDPNRIMQLHPFENSYAMALAPEVHASNAAERTGRYVRNAGVERSVWSPAGHAAVVNAVMALTGCPDICAGLRE